MSDTDHIAPEDEGRVAAAEYVLGVLPAAERRALEERLAREPALAREVAYWEERLGGLADSIKPVAPPAQAWLRIEAVLSEPAGHAPRQASLWDSLVFWRGFGISTAALAAASIAAFAYVAIVTPSQQPVQPRVPMLATLSGAKTGQPNFVAAVGADGTSLTIVPAALLTADKRSVELWLIPQGGAPRSLGLIAAGQPVRLTVPKDLIGSVASGATLAVSLEPPGGSPTGAPTGPVIAHGNLADL
jgi:anti-sigma-K factor RskA